MRPLSKNLLLGVVLGLLSWSFVELGVSSLRSLSAAGPFHYLYLGIPWILGLITFLLLRADHLMDILTRAVLAVLLCLFLMACFDLSQLRHTENMVTNGGFATLFHLISCFSGLVAGGIIAAYRTQP